MSATFSGMTIEDTIRSDAEGQKTIQNTQVINFRMLRNWVPVLHKLWIHNKFNTSVNCDNLCGCPRKSFLRFRLASFFPWKRVYCYQLKIVNVCLENYWWKSVYVSRWHLQRSSLTKVENWKSQAAGLKWFGRSNSHGPLMTFKC